MTRLLTTLMMVAILMTVLVIGSALAQSDATPVPRTTETGSRESPISFGTAADIGGGWIVHVLAVDSNATDVIAENMFNATPESGFQAYIVKISATYEGEGSGSFAYSNPFSLLGDLSIEYNQAENSCGAIPDQAPNAEVFSGGTIRFNECWIVPSDEAEIESLVLFADDPVDIMSDRRVWFSLSNEGQATPEP